MRFWPLPLPVRLAFFLVVGSLASSVSAEDWPTFLGPRADSKSTETGIKTSWPAEGPPIRWKLPLGEGYCMCSIQDGKLYQFDSQEEQARLRCLDAATAELIWTFSYHSEYNDLYSYDRGPRCAPLIDGDRLYLFGVEGMLHCLNTKDGTIVWKQDTQKEFGVIQNFFGVGSTPCLYGDLLIVMVGGSPEESKQLPPGQIDLVSGNGTGIVAFDKFTGSVQYKFSDELASYASPIIAEWDQKAHCLAFTRGGLLAFDPANGTEEFFFPWRSDKLESVNASNPVVVDREILISETYGPGGVLLRHEKGKNPQVVWSDLDKPRNKSIQTHWNTPIVHEGYVYASSGRHSGNAELRCLEWSSGKVRWSQPGFSRCSLLYVDGHLICLAEYGTLRLIKVNPERYEEVAAVELAEKSSDGKSVPLLDYPAWSAPVVSGGRLYVRGKSFLICLQLK
ncbi:MAG: PQQ-like beta-propeller repeat protein [Planctomycetota bacterium]|nr:PQQ-like beta-propeller repeat protein [Planctomycetota bacterium]